MKNTIIHAESLATLRSFESDSIDSIITDPPYEIGFVGKSWDSTGIAYSVEFWSECLRVLKPGGHLLSFGATRTWHRMATAVEDAGFEIRDSLAWMYGSGMPKNSDISKHIDKIDGDPDKEIKFTTWMRTTGVTRKQVTEATGLVTMAGHYFETKSQPAIPTPEIFDLMRPLFSDAGVAIPEWIEGFVQQRGIESEAYKARKIVGSKSMPKGHVFSSSAFGGNDDRSFTDVAITKAHNPEAKKWEGWGTALKPAFEPIVLARKPLARSSVARNVLVFGVGGINIDATRIGERWTTNVILDESQAEQVDAFSKEASRFFYCAKPNKSERIKVEGVAHPTVKPLALMRYLIRLATPVGGVVLDPFAGSGTTLEAAKLEGFDFIGIEMTESYIPLIEARLERAASVR